VVGESLLEGKLKKVDHENVHRRRRAERGGGGGKRRGVLEKRGKRWVSGTDSLHRGERGPMRQSLRKSGGGLKGKDREVIWLRKIYELGRSILSSL